jgi:4-amino-4-deoxy-L-arabinose transferase
MASKSAATNPSSAPVSPAYWRDVLAWPLWLRLLLPVLAALIVGVAFQGTRGLTETSETRYAECAREMLLSGNWLEPSLEFQPHWTKPPVAYWCVALGMKIFGVNAWGARMPGVAALLVTVLAVFAAGRRLWGERAGLLAATAIALGFPAVGAYIVTTDIYLTAAEALAALAFLFAATEADQARRSRYAVAMWAAWGLGFMIKGPPALLPMLAFIPWNLLQPRERRVPLGDWRGLLAFVAVAAPWYVAMRLRHPDLLSYYVNVEIVARVSSNLGHNRAWYKAIEIYGPAMLGVAGPFGVWAAVLAWRGGWGRVAKWRELCAARDLRLLVVGWVVLPLVVFCLSRSKLHLYVLPLAVPLALLAGRVLAARARMQAFRTVAVVVLVALVAFKGAAGYLPNPRDMAALSREVRAELVKLPAGAPVILWEQGVNHGVTFYLGLGRDALPERVAPDTKGKFETWTVAEFSERVRSGRYDHGALLIVSAEKHKREALDAALPGLPVVAEHQGSAWHLLHLGAPKPVVPAP